MKTASTKIHVVNFNPDGLANKDAGVAFRAHKLVLALNKFDKVEVDLDCLAGHASSGLCEAFGGLVSVEGFDASTLRQKMTVVAEDKSLIYEVWDYIHNGCEVAKVPAFKQMTTKEVICDLRKNPQRVLSAEEKIFLAEKLERSIKRFEALQAIQAQATRALAQ